jgi:predicted phosphodiesterase
LARTAAAIRLLEAAGATQFLHCGDVTRPPMLELFAGKSAAFVLGNNDERHATTLRAAAEACGVTCLDAGAVVTWAGVPIAVTHGHRGAEVQRLLKLKPRILCMGIRTSGATNPGARSGSSIREPCIAPGLTRPQSSI